MTHQGVKFPNPWQGQHSPGKARFISEAEKILIPYKFGVYDILVLPPSVPYGGMCVSPLSPVHPANPTTDRENACLTFLTPSTFHVTVFHDSHVVV